MIKSFTYWVLFFLCTFSYAQERQRLFYQSELLLKSSLFLPAYNGTFFDNGTNYIQTAKGGNSYGIVLVSSLNYRKFFLDLDLNFFRAHLFERIYLTGKTPYASLNAVHKLNIFAPNLALGHFFAIANHARISLGLSVGNSFLLFPRKVENVLKIPGNPGADTFYEYDFSYSRYTALNAGLLFGVYIPMKKNELVFKTAFYLNTQTAIIFTEFREIKNYTPVELYSTSSGAAKTSLSFSIGYRFSNNKKN